MKKCVFILPYFGNYPNYFQLFINSCGKNESFDWFIFTDCNQQLTVPTNVHIFKTSLQEINKRANEKFGFEVSMSNPYKLCDYKPAYGFIFEDLISEYEYWGHCDCDLIFGNLEKLLLPLLNEHYDKLFAAGHLTIYKNDTLNNRVFMSLCNGVELYKRVYNSDKIFVFDEDCGETNNIHSIFLSQSKKVYSTDMSMNMSTSSSRIIREFYDEKNRSWCKEEYISAKYYWCNGNLVRVLKKDNKIGIEEFLYMHLQMRVMKINKKIIDSNLYQILPTKFSISKKLYCSKLEYINCFWLHIYRNKIRNKLKKNKLEKVIFLSL